MKFLEHILQSYGYLATGVGCFFEGEAVLLVAAFLAHKGYLRLEWIIIVAALGAFMGDVASFFLAMILLAVSLIFWLTRYLWRRQQEGNRNA